MTFLSIGEGRWHVESPSWVRTARVMCGRKVHTPTYTASQFSRGRMWPDDVCKSCQRRQRAFLQSTMDQLVRGSFGYNVRSMEHDAIVMTFVMGGGAE